MTNNFICYILRNNNEKYKNRTYNGFTNNIKRRIRQHNGIIKGGAKYTCRYRIDENSWQIIAIVSGFPDKINALQCEWRIKHPDNKKRRKNKYNTPSGRIMGLNEVLKLNKWTNNSTVENTFKINVLILDEYSHLLSDLPDNVRVEIFKDVDSL